MDIRRIRHWFGGTCLLYATEWLISAVFLEYSPTTIISKSRGLVSISWSSIWNPEFCFNNKPYMQSTTLGILVCYLIKPHLPTFDEVGTIVPILHMRKLAQRHEGACPSHAAGEWQNQDLSPGLASLKAHPQQLLQPKVEAPKTVRCRSNSNAAGCWGGGWVPQDGRKLLFQSCFSGFPTETEQPQFQHEWASLHVLLIRVLETLGLYSGNSPNHNS